MSEARLLRVGYMLADPRRDLSHGSSRVHVERLVYRLRALGHEVNFVAVQPGEVVLIDTGFGLQQFFEATHYESETKRTGVPRPTILFSDELLRFADEKGFPVSELATSDLAFCAARRTFRDCELVHTTLSPVDVGGLLCARALQKPLVVEVEAPPPIETKHSESGQSHNGSERLARFAAQETLEAATAIVTASSSLRDFLVSEWNIKPGKVAVLPHAVEAPSPTLAARVTKLRVEHRLGFGPVVAFVGELQPWHALESLLVAFGKVIGEHPKAKLLLVGDGPERDRLEEQAGTLDLNASVRFTGELEHELVSELINIAEIAVAPCSRPPFEHHFSPAELVAYMAAGRAIVSARGGNQEEILTDGETALLVEPGNDDELAQAIGRLLGDSRLRRQLGDRAREVAERNHDWTSHIRRLTTIYETALGSDA